MIFILDTNIFVADFFQKGPGFRVLQGLFLKTPCKLLIPDIIRSETFKKYGEHLKKAVADSKGKLSRVLDSQVFRDNFEQEEFIKFKSFFVKRLDILTNNRVEVDSHPDINVDDLIDKCLEGKKPFTTNGKEGFRDSVIWECVKAALINNPKQDVVFISSNSQDFSSETDKKSIHPELKDEIEDTKSKNQDFYFFLSLTDLKTFLGKESDHITEFEDKLFSYINENYEEIFSLLMTYSLDQEDLITPILPPEATEPTIRFLEVVDSPKVIEIRSIDTDEKLILIEVKLHLEIDFFMDKHDYYAYEDDMDFDTEDANWNKWTVSCSASREITCSFELIYDLQNSEITSLDRKNMTDPTLI